ncbi:hypothetical protein V8G54_036562, partial [Vigna mungo]
IFIRLIVSYIILFTNFDFSSFIASMSSFSNEDQSNDNQSQENNLRKGPWTAEEDAILAEYVTKHGPGNWNIVQQNTGLLRCGKSCRLRWTNHLRPDLRRGAFTKEEQRKVIELHAEMGNKWAKMAQKLPGRTDNEIKNFWNTRLKKRKRIGLDLYPDGIKPVSDSHNPNTILATYTHGNEVVGTSSQHAMLNNFSNTQNQPLPVQPVSMVRENMKPPQEMQPSEVPQLLQLPEAGRSSYVPHVVFNTPNKRLRVQPNSMVRGNMKPSGVPQGIMQLSEVPEELQRQGTSSYVPHVVFNNSSNTPNQPLSVQAISMVRENMEPSGIPQEIMQLPDVLEELQLPEADFDALLGDFAYDDYACLDGPFSTSELPPLPSCHDITFEESMIVRENSQAETNQYYEPRSPRSNGYLESMFYPPKVSQEQDDFSMQGKLNMRNATEISYQRKPENEDVLGDLIWPENQHDDALNDYVRSFLKP